MNYSAKLLVVSPLLFFCLSQQSSGLQLLYDLEGDSGSLITDKLTGDGSQNGVSFNNVTIDANPALTPGFGNNVAFFDNPPAVDAAPYSYFEIPGTTFDPNFSVTMAAWVKTDDDIATSGRFRIFSSFSGTGGVADILMLDVGHSATSANIRGIVGGQSISPSVPGLNVVESGYHHYAMTIDNSLAANNRVSIYVDGMSLTLPNYTIPNNYFNKANLVVGEDVNTYPLSNSASEQLNGNVDDVLVLGRALSSADIASIYAGGVGAPVSSVVTPLASELGVYYDFEGDTGSTITDKFIADGLQSTSGTQTAMIDTNSANAKIGGSSIHMDDPRGVAEDQDIYSQIKSSANGNLGANFTLSAVVNPWGNGQFRNGIARLFSSYEGAGSTAGRLLLDYNPTTATGIRLFLPSNTGSATLTAAGPGLPDSDLTTGQTLTVVYETGATNDSVFMYLDGDLIASKTDLAPGTVQSLGDQELRIGEDSGGFLGAFANENYLGSLDDVLVLNRSLNPAQVQFLHENGAAALIDTLGPLTTPGDYNSDGSVDAADYTVWRDSFNQTGSGLAADGNGDEVIDQDDYMIWKVNYGTTTGGSSTAANTVPEPTAALLVATLTGLLATRRR